MKTPTPLQGYRLVKSGHIKSGDYVCNSCVLWEPALGTVGFPIKNYYTSKAHGCWSACRKERRRRISKD